MDCPMTTNSSKTQQHIDTLIDLRHDRLATEFVMVFYNVNEETASRLYKDEIEATKNLMKNSEFRKIIESRVNHEPVWNLYGQQYAKEY